MANSEKIKVGESSGRSRTIAPNSGGFFLEGDSITIVYQGKVYYYNTGTITGGIPWEDSKNIINPKNYNFINRILDTKCDLETEAIFRFDDSMFQ